MGENKVMTLGYDNLSVKLGAEELNQNYLYKLEITKKINDHTRIYLQQLVEEE